MRVNSNLCKASNGKAEDEEEDHSVKGFKMPIKGGLR